MFSDQLKVYLLLYGLIIFTHLSRGVCRFSSGLMSSAGDFTDDFLPSASVGGVFSWCENLQAVGYWFISETHCQEALTRLFS